VNFSLTWFLQRRSCSVLDYSVISRYRGSTIDVKTLTPRIKNVKNVFFMKKYKNLKNVE